ncbi:MAG: hypothetical protein PHO10_10275, partial [Gemmiger sp.]|nr:hypothetical protein [Gemmiger sp.]
MGRLKKRTAPGEIPLALFFLQYFGYLLVAVVLIGLGLLLAFSLLLAGDVVYPADYAQTQASLAYEPLSTAAEITPAMIPELCRYAVFGPDGSLVGGNLASGDAAHAWAAVQGQPGGGHFYKVIPRASGYCVLQYNLVPEYKSPLLRQYLPNPQNLLFVL